MATPAECRQRGMRCAGGWRVGESNGCRISERKDGPGLHVVTTASSSCLHGKIPLHLDGKPLAENTKMFNQTISGAGKPALELLGSRAGVFLQAILYGSSGRNQALWETQRFLFGVDEKVLGRLICGGDFFCWTGCGFSPRWTRTRRLRPRSVRSDTCRRSRGEWLRSRLRARRRVLLLRF